MLYFDLLKFLHLLMKRFIFCILIGMEGKEECMLRVAKGV